MTDKQSDALNAAQPAPQYPGVGNNRFDHKTAADFLNGRTVSDEAMRKFVAASRWAHDDRAGLQAKLLSVRNELAAREAEIALLKTELMDAEAAPQQEAQEPVAWRELCRRLYVELFYCDKQMTSGKRPKWQQGKTVRDVLADAKAALDAHEAITDASSPLQMQIAMDVVRRSVIRNMRTA